MNDIENNNRDFLLTTVDNPYDPFEEFDAWLAFDSGKGYNTCGLLARLTPTIESSSDFNDDLTIELAMQQIIKDNPYGVHKIVYQKK